MKTAAPERPHKRIAVAVVFKDDLILIDQRLDTSMLGGLWEFPGGKIEPGETAADCVVREVQEEIGIEVEAIAHLTDVDHAYTHLTVTLHTYICRYLSGSAQPLQCADVRWVRHEELSEFAFPMANQKIFPQLDLWLQRQGDR